jgi:hypothetical protein
VMRNNIPRRLNELERKAHIHDPPQPVIFVKFVTPGQSYQSNSARCLDSSQAWERRTGETEEAFERRVSEGLNRDEQSPTVVLFHPESKTDASSEEPDAIARSPPASRQPSFQ